VEISLRKFNETDEDDLMMLMINDITSVRNLEKSKQLQRMKTIYFCSVAHDLKTPINSIIATNSHLKEKFRKDQEVSRLFKINLSSC